MGEFERANTTAINAYVSPAISGYLRGLSRQFDSPNHKRAIYTMQSNGGAMTSETASARSVHALLSGPAGGLIGSGVIAHTLGVDNAISIDVGGTSADVGLIVDGVIQQAPKAEIAGSPVVIPFLDIQTVGAGGGSIAWLDAAGALRVGPHSAGSSPGPICYGRGGSEPTVTDAHAVLGNIGSDTLLGGRERIDSGAALRGVEGLARQLGISPHETAAGIIEVADSAMFRAVRVLTVERGLDPAQFTLIAFGGAGPLHAVSLARSLGITRILVPPYAGVFSAVGMLDADVRHDFVESHIALLDELDQETFSHTVDALAKKGRRALAADGFAASEMVLDYWVEMQYVGQAHQLPVRFDRRAYEDPAGVLQGAFHEAHRCRYGFAFEGEAIEIAQYGVTASAAIFPFAFPEAQGSPCGATKQGTRVIWFEDEPVDTPVFRGSDVEPGVELEGPCVLEFDDTTAVIPPGSLAARRANGAFSINLL
jgi:N-methylhydantoinase A